MRFGATVRHLFLMFVLLVLSAAAAVAQTSPVEIVEDSVRPGINGFVQRGSWTPLRMTVRNNTSKPRPVYCQWVLTDHDGDVAHYQRKVTLPRGELTVWLYAPLPIRTESNTQWRLLVLDAAEESDDANTEGNEGAPGEVLASLTILPPSDNGGLFSLEGSRIIATTGTHPLGLEPYGTDDLKNTLMQHEETTVLHGLEPDHLPDQWQGLSMLQAIIWTPRGPDPNAADMPMLTQAAIREWIRHGGHLVIIMPSFGNPWVDSFLGDAFPPVQIGTLEGQTTVPAWIRPNTPANYSSDFRTFEPLPGVSPAQVAVLLRDQAGHPLVVTSNYGFGRITLIGIDITDSRLTLNVEDQYERGLWGAVFGWRYPAWSSTRIRLAMDQNKLVRHWTVSPQTLDSFIIQRVSMTDTAATALLAAMLVFIVYWLAAGPVGFAVLKARGKVQHAWAIFAAVVAVFTLVAWGGAAVMRPQQSRIQHFSVVDVDAGSGLMHVHSWASLFLPRHRPVPVVIDPENTMQNTNTVACIGLDPADRSGFLDSQDYFVSASRPFNAEFPMRSTARQIEIDFLGDVPTPESKRLKDWTFPQNKVRLVNGKLQGELMHDLPGALRDVMLVYSPGAEADSTLTLEVWFAPGDTWEPRTLLAIDHQPAPPNARGPRSLVARPYPDDALTDPEAKKSERVWFGYLGGLVDSQGGVTGNTAFKDTHAVRMLTFYDVLPPPDFRDVSPGITSISYFARGTGRRIDLSPRLATRCLIIIGTLDQSPLPVPLTADNGEIGSQGVTVVRWVCPVE